MIRWRFITTRLIVVVALLWVLTLALGPIAKIVTVQGVERSLGSRIEIGSAAVGLTPPRVIYRDVALADPRGGKAMRNAFTADSIELEIDGTELLHRRWVVRRGRVDGLVVGGRRDASGHLDEPESAGDEPTDDDGPSMLVRLMGGAGDAITAEARTRLDALQTPKEGRRIADDWERRYKETIARGETLRRQLESGLESVKGIDNPLRDWRQLQHALADGQATRQSMAELTADLRQASAWAEADREALRNAKRADLEAIDGFVPGDLSDAESVGIDLIAAGVKKQIADIRRLLDGTRQVADYTVLAPEDHDRHRGRWYDFDPRPHPELLIRQCGVSGLFRHGGEVFQMDGTVENLTPTPERLRRPTSVRLRLDGPQVIRAHYVADRRDATPTDRLVLHWPSMPADDITLGGDGSTGLAVTGGNQELWVSVVNRDGAIEGHLRSRRDDVAMTLRAGGDVADTAAAKSLADSLASIRRIDIDARFGGRWTDLDMDLSTNLGDAFKGAIRDAASEQLVASRQAMSAEVEKAYLEQTLKLNELQQRFADEIAKLETKADDALAAIKSKVINEVDDADAYIGRLQGLLR